MKDKIRQQITVSDNAQILAVVVTLLSRMYSGDRVQLLKAVLAMFDKRMVDA